MQLTADWLMPVQRSLFLYTKYDHYIFCTCSLSIKSLYQNMPGEHTCQKNLTCWASSHPKGGQPREKRESKTAIVYQTREAEAEAQGISYSYSSPCPQGPSCFTVACSNHRGSFFKWFPSQKLVSQYCP